MSRLLVVLAVQLIVTCAASAATIHVPGDESTIADGISAASEGDTVLVACGTYYEHDITMKSGITLRSETGNAECVTIDAEDGGCVLRCAGTNDDTRVEGLTLTEGNSSEGGAVWCFSSSLTFSHVVLKNSFATHGGGMFCGTGSSPTIDNCVFRNNASIMGEGGGMFCESGSSPSLTTVTFEGNSGFGGAGMYCRDSSPVLTNVVFSGNHASSMASSYGGGIQCRNSSLFLTYVTFEGNTAEHGAALSCSDAYPTLSQVTISGNASDVGSAVYCYDSSPVIGNSIIAFNGIGPALYCVGSCSPVLSCCDIYGNAGGDWVGCIASQYGANGNISEDPLFCAELNPEEPLSLHGGSPCAPASGSDCGLIGAWDVGCDMSPVIPVDWGRIKATYR